MKLRAVHTVPVWDDDGEVHIAGIGEERPEWEDQVVGWVNIAQIDLAGEDREFLLVVPRNP